MATATGTITDNSDSVRATVTPNDATVVEGSVATFTVDLGVATGSRDVVVTYNTDPDPNNADDPAADSDDYDAPEGTLVIPAGQSMGTIAITTRPDDLLEGIETLRVTLTDAVSDVGNVEVASRNTEATIDIGDPNSTILVSVEDGTTTEGEDAILLVKLSGKVSGVVTVPYELGGPGDTAGAGDYTNNPEPVAIPEGMTTGTITVPTTLDNDAENAETFTVTLGTLTSPPAGVEVALGDATATATINDDDPLTVTVTGAARFREGDPATFTVNLNGGMGSMPIEVDYTVGGMATKGTDYVEPEGTLVINPLIDLESVSGTITIQTRQDSEADETLVVTLTNARTDAGRVTVGTPRAAHSTLVVRETVIITVGDADVTEGASTMAQLYSVP